MQNTTSGEGVNTHRPSFKKPYLAQQARTQPSAPAVADELPADASFELRFADMIARDEDYVIGGRLRDGEDTRISHWNGSHWEVCSSLMMTAKALRWMRGIRPDKTNKANAYGCAQTAVAELMGRPDRYLPASGDRPIIPVEGAYLEILEDGRIRAMRPDKSCGLMHKVPAAFDWKNVTDQGYFVPQPLNEKSKWASYLQRFFPDTQVRSYLQEAVASSLLPVCYEKGFFLCGSGSNGKSTLLHVLAALHPMRTAVRLEKLGGQFAIHPIANKTLITSAEIPRVLNKETQETLKQVISRDEMQAEQKGSDPYTMRPIGTYFGSCNAFPQVSSQDHGWKRKVVGIPFDVCLKEGDKSRKTDFHRLILNDPEEMGQVLNWVLEGAIRLVKQNGFSELPPRMVALAKEHDLLTDTVIAYMADRSMESSSEVRTCKKAIYADYVEFAKVECGRGAVSVEEFWRRVKEKHQDIQEQQLYHLKEKHRCVSLVVDNLPAIRDTRIKNGYIPEIDDVPM